ncbi:MAG: serine hydrolase [Bacteroidales bacterium]|nr:serine hydrolase [Bacteroidales bacterium]MCL2132886.1 serine hydrolase [Bacteroidales bacterium]
MKKILLMAGITLLLSCTEETLVLPEPIPTEPPVASELPENVPGQPTKDWYMGRTAEVGITQNVPIIQLAYKTRDRKFMFETANFSFVTASPDVTTMFQAASVSKALFSYIVMRYVDRGMIDLDKPLYEYTGGVVKERFRNAIPGDPVASARNEEWAKLLTARIVLTHGTALRNWQSSTGWPSEEKLVFTGEPDQMGYTYSGEGIQYLQEVLEHISGLSLNQMAEQEVFGPFGMEYSSYVWRSEYATTHAFGYDANNVLGTGRGEAWAGNAAYTLRTNVRDFSIFIEKCIMEGQGLERKTHEAWLSPSRLNNNLGLYFGLGVRVNPNQAFDYGPTYAHGGSNPRFRCHFIVFPKAQTYLVYFSNSDNGAGTTLQRLYAIFFPQYPGVSYG